VDEYYRSSWKDKNKFENEKSASKFSRFIKTKFKFKVKFVLENLSSVDNIYSATIAIN